MPNNKTVHVLKGMDRLENIMEKISIEESINILINAMIKNKGSLEYIEIKKEKESKKREETINIIAIGESVTDIFYIDYNKILNDNKVLQAIISIATEVRVEVSKNGVKKEQTLNLSKINNGFIEVGYIYESKIQLEKENIKFVINKGKLAVNGRGLLDDKKLENIREYIKERYNQAINDGMKIRLLEDNTLKAINIDGNIINEDKCIVDENAKIILYKLNYEKKGFEVTINDVKVSTDTISNLINWRKDPLVKSGYTFTRLLICLRLNIYGFDLNDKSKIDLYVKKYEKRILQMIRDNSEDFLSENVNINLKYNKNNMDCIKSNLNEDTASGVVKRLLDEHINKIKK